MLINSTTGASTSGLLPMKAGHTYFADCYRSKPASRAMLGNFFSSSAMRDSGLPPYLSTSFPVIQSLTSFGIPASLASVLNVCRSTWSGLRPSR